MGEAHRRGACGLCVSQWSVERSEVAALIVLGGIIDTCRERSVGIRLRIGGVRPLHLETGGFVVVWQVFFACDGGEIRDIEVAAIGISLGIVGLC